MIGEFVVSGRLEYWRHPFLERASHGFFTRKWGRSKGVLASLNCGYGAEEPRGVVDRNRHRISGELCTEQKLQTGFQHHSRDVVILEEPFKGEPAKCDGLVTDRPGLPIAILTADCAPILLIDQDARIVGAAHAGWRGALDGVVEGVVEKMRELGADRIFAVVGACISQANYEVGDEFVEIFTMRDPRYARFFSDKPHSCGFRALTPSGLARGQQPESSGSQYFNLPGFVLSRLEEAGAIAQWIGACTYADEAKYYSYRRATHRGEPDYGRLASVIMVPE